MSKLKFHVQYQPLSKGAARPEDWGSAHAYEVSAHDHIPAVGDYVSLIPIGAVDGYLSFNGKVKSRLFRQFTRYDKPTDAEPAEINVAVNIVVEEANNDDWGLLIKE